MHSYLKRIGLPALGLVVFAACTPADDAELETDEAEEMTQPTEPVDPEPYTVRPQADGTVTGSVEIDPNEDGTEISVNFSGLTPGEHAWHIHRGTCASAGDVVVPFTDTQTMTGIGDPLTVNDDGTVDATVDVPSSSLAPNAIETGQYSLHVHERGGTDHGPSVACVNLSRM